MLDLYQEWMLWLTKSTSPLTYLRRILFQVTGSFYVNAALEELLFEELRCSCANGIRTYIYPDRESDVNKYIGSHGGFLPAVRQIANVAALPGNRQEKHRNQFYPVCIYLGIVKKSIGLPDLHSGYGFAIGNVAAFDMANPESIVSPGGVVGAINSWQQNIFIHFNYERVLISIAGCVYWEPIWLRRKSDQFVSN